MGVTTALEKFADEIGRDDRIWIAGHGSRTPAPSDVRIVRAPAGVIDFQPDEMTLRCGAGTPIAEVDDVLAARGQYVNLGQAGSSSGTVGGALAVGHDDHLRLGRGSMRDSLLEARYVDGEGRVIVAGGPTVKNVSGFDLCRLLVGSRGTLGALGEVVLRTRPLPRRHEWWRMTDVVDPNAVLDRLHRPTSFLWDGGTAWILIEGHRDDIERSRGGFAVEIVEGPPSFAALPHRHSYPPSRMVVTTPDIGEVGVGLVHSSRPGQRADVPDAIRAIHDRLLDGFDPRRRLNPGLGHPLDW